MNCRAVFVFLSLLVGLPGAIESYAQTHGIRVSPKPQIPQKPKRIVTLTPALGEMVMSLLGSEVSRLVGVTEPKPTGNFVSVGSYHQVSLERVVSLKPDLVIADLDGNPKDRVLRLKELGIPVIFTEQRSLSEIETTVLLVAEVLGKSQKGQIQVKEFRSQLDRLKERYQFMHPRRVLLQLGDDPLLVVGSASFLNDCLRTLGAENVYQSSSASYPRPSWEDAVLKNPDDILILSFGNRTALDESMKNKWLSFKSLKAVQSQRLKVIQSDELLRPNLQVIKGLRVLGQVIYGI